MNQQKGMFLTVVATTVLLFCWSLEPVNGLVCVGELPTWAHGVQGELCIVDQTTLVIRNFFYDSGGPDAFLYFYRIGNDPPFTASDVRLNQRTGGGESIPHPDTGDKFPTGTPISDGTLQFSLPPNVYACDIAVFTIWCRGASTHFTGIDIPASLFTTDPSEAADGSKILCNRGQVCVGSLPDLSHGVGGELCFLDQSTILLKNFNYNTQGPDAHLYGYPTGNDPAYTAQNVQTDFNGGGGFLISYPNTDDGALPMNTGGIVDETVEISLPDGVYACDMAVFTVWCRQASVQFSTIDIPPEIFTTDPSEAADGSKILCNRGQVCVGSLPDLSHGVGGELCFLDQSTILLKNFNYNTQGPDAHLYGYPTGNDPAYTAQNVQTDFNGGGGFLISYPNTDDGALPMNTGGIVDETVEISLPDGRYACDMAVFTVWCRQASVQFSTIDIPPEIFTTDENEAADGSKILCNRAQEPDAVCAGSLPTLSHEVEGELCFIDQSTLLIKNFNYDTQGPDAHLYVYLTGNDPPFTAENVLTDFSTGGGVLVPYPETDDGALPFNTGGIVDKTFQFSLPFGVYACDIAVFTVWCRQAGVQFSALEISQDLFTSDEVEAAEDDKILCTREPDVVCIGTLPNLAHGVGGELCFIDQSTLLIKNFEYDTQGPDAHLYGYPTGNEPPFTAGNVQTDFNTGGGYLISYPNTDDGALPFNTGGVMDEALVISLPDGRYACDMAVFTVWCRQAGVQFSTIDIPPEIFTTDADEAAEDDKILCNRDGGSPELPDDFENCKQLDESLSLSWTVDRSSESVRFMLCGCTSASIEQDNTWLGFGLSGNTGRTQMFGADATIVWVDDEDGPQAEDYFLSAYTQCRDGVGACPDSEDSSGVCVNDARLVGGSREDGKQCVVFTRDFAANDICDLDLDPDNEDQYIVWGVGGLGETAFRHFVRAESGDPPLHLGRASSSDCVPLQCSFCEPFQNERIEASSSTTFVAHIGPSGDSRGYMAITGRAGWGIAWYIDGTLIPELVVQRGQTYTFIVYGGDDPTTPARYHPFYITDSPSGGRLLNDAEENEAEVVYAGFNGEEPIGVGPLCEYKITATAIAAQEDCNSPLSAYEAGLAPPASNCGAGVTTNVFTWTPDDDTPDLVYYQCASHLNLGWKIIVESVDPDPVDPDPVDPDPVDPDTMDPDVEDTSFPLRASLPLSLIALFALLCIAY